MLVQHSPIPMYRPVFGGNPNPLETQLTRLHHRLLKVATRDTAMDAASYDEFAPKTSALWGHCAIVAALVKSLFGGKLIRAVLQVQAGGKKEQQIHYFNEIDGKRYDLTSDQYLGDGLHAVTPQPRPKANAPIAVLKILHEKVGSDGMIQRANRFKLLKQRLGIS